MASLVGWRHSREGRNFRRWMRALHPKGSDGYRLQKRAARRLGRCWVELARDVTVAEEAARAAGQVVSAEDACKPSVTPQS